ncbi:orotate phosphoribosyltransferase [Vaginisenegalia massiliensis]|uniref:orotate phosphoribosyltransferase n=1 Tax=Vaginisenegalia massiliensis TaxID=2058294 RepID=UPI000F53FBCC|nr:orotate phosphoribosyltransferase [Vaginisenegalia massiliensis]
MENLSQEIAKTLLEINAVCLSPEEPFTWTSGLRTPIYCDNRLIMSHPQARKVVEAGFVQVIKERFAEVDVVAGTATAGIPHAAFIAQLLDLPMIYVRSSAKEHGRQNQIEGQLIPGQRVLMVEDLISTGKSVIHAAHAVQEAHGKVIGCVAVFNYLLQSGKDAFAQEDFPLVTLTNYTELVKLAVQRPELAAYEDKLTQWYLDPIAWSQAHA